MVKHVQMIVEYRSGTEGVPEMRWEKSAEGGAFELLGRAFEVAQREEAVGFAEALAAFCRGALVGRQDVMDALSGIDEPRA